MNRFLTLLTCLALCLTGCASTMQREQVPNPAAVPAQAVFLLYNKGLNSLSAVRTGSCPMHPSCSAYSREAFSKHGLLRGWWMTFDRLLRCGRDEMHLTPRTLVHGTWKVYDPVSHNDQWWYKPQEKASPELRGP